MEHAERGEYLKDPYHDPRHDPYFLRRKYKEPSCCEQCGVVFSNGKFEHADAPPAGAEKMVCPACARIRDKYEGGEVRLSGLFLAMHREEILNLVHNVAEAEYRQRPLERLIELTENAEGIRITTTYEHLSRRIGEALHSAYKGDLQFHYPEGEKYIRLRWHRD
jgi:hypothetical protein